MKVKDIILLGFVSKAADYLRIEFEKNNCIDDLKKIDDLNLEAIKVDLLEKIEESLGLIDDSASSLIKIGSDAFDEFMGVKKANALLGEITKIFNDGDEELKNDEANKVKEDLEELLSFYQPVDEPQIADDDEFLKIITEAANKANNENTVPIYEEVKTETKSELDEIFSEIVGSEIVKEETVKPEPVVKPKPVVKPTKKESENEIYLKELVNGLRKRLQEEKAKKKPVLKTTVFEKISELYPNLSGGFVRAVYDLKNSLSSEYEDGIKIIVLHRVYFKNVDSLRQFVEIVSNHDYTVNVDEKKLIVDVFKQHINQDGKILTNIFEIANQAKVLEGEYEGYRVVRMEEK